MSQSCIWCGNSPADSLEHIAPDALGCPAEFVLVEGVCKKCNHDNGRLDRALLTPFEIIIVLKAIPRKRGRKPTIDGFASMANDYDKYGPVLFLNAGPSSVEIPKGKILKGMHSDNPIQNFKHKTMKDGAVELSYTQQLRFDRNSVRGLFKIALESVAYFQGVEFARQPLFDPIRDFVINSSGDFRALVLADQNEGYESYFHVGAEKPGYERVVGMTLLGIGFLCDFDPAFRGGHMILDEYDRQQYNMQAIPNWPKNLWRKNNLK